MTIIEHNRYISVKMQSKLMKSFGAPELHFLKFKGLLPKQGLDWDWTGDGLEHFSCI